MPGYLLLRSNKESGPFALQELITLGLKPYDLVWVEGKSAAWRYPGEIAELTPYAPIVEEQPYDRFYKKNNQQVDVRETIIAEKNVKTVSANTTQLVADTIVVQPGNGKQIPDTNPYKRVFVTLPAGVQVVGSAKSTRAGNVEPTVEAVVAVNKTPILPEPEITSAKNVVPESVALEEKYSMPLDDLKQLYIDNVLKQKKKKGARFNLGSNVVMFLAVSAFFALVIVVGALISEKKDKMSALVQPAVRQDAFIQQKANDTEVDQSGDAPSERQVGKEQAILPIAEKRGQTKKDEEFLPSNPQPVKVVADINNGVQKTAEYRNEPIAFLEDEAMVTSSTPPPATTVSIAEKNEPEHATIPGNKPMNEPVVYKAASYPATPDPEKASTKKKIKKLVVIDKVDYKTGLLGGIKNVSVSLSNHSNYKMDLVIVDVDYLKANDNTIKTERLYFKNMLPDAALTLEAPSGQGSKIDCRITLISSKELDYLYATIN
jgi:hypothetical protein